MNGVGHRKAIAAARRAAAAPKPATAVPMVRRPKPGDPRLAGPKAGVPKGADPKIGRAPIAVLTATTDAPKDVLDPMVAGQMIVVLKGVVRRDVVPTFADLMAIPAGRPKVLAAAKKAAIARAQSRFQQPI